MPGWSYEAVDAQGRRRHGTVEAPSAAAARRALRGRNLLPVKLGPAGSGGLLSGLRPGRAASLPDRVLVLVTRQLATLIGAGLPVEEALRAVAAQAAPRPAAMLSQMRAAILDGRSLGQAMEAHPAAFGEFYLASVRAGEAAGRLGEVMEHLASHVEARARNRQTVRLALLYPALLALVSVAVVVGLLTFVVPDIVRVFASRGAELPALTRALIALSDGLARHGAWIAGGLAAACVVLGALLRRPALRGRWHAALLRLPGVGALTRRLAAQQFTGTLATLVSSRVPLADALPSAARTISNLDARRRAAALAERVREGVSLSAAMGDAGIFPPLLVAMAASGEASGDLAGALTRAAADQTREVEAVTSAVVGLVEPAVLLVMGLVVMLLVLAILLPIINLNTLV